ncbi:MAG: T9SS type A sorting domain-containing protein [Bacteroidetes bacterium]|nr:T9SS type A sorting domain-containing protein [Bacteroidota bacterium]
MAYRYFLSSKVCSFFIGSLFLLFSINAKGACDYGTGSVGANPTAPLISYSGNDGTISANGTIPAGIYNFVNFTINAGVTITISGGTGPLIIRCTGTATINGIIRFEGGNGSAAPGGATGGIGGAGANGWGGDGGAGGKASGTPNGNSGTSFGTSNGGGAGGIGAPNSNPFAGGGGGGGGYQTVGSNGTASDGGAGGAGGSLYGDALLTTTMTQSSITTNLLGGSGGGGGGGRGSITKQGGGGAGGGGGAIQVTGNTVVFGAGGLLSVQGGNGAQGYNLSGGYGGSGGGGSGGTISIQYLTLTGFVLGTNSNIAGGTGPAGNGSRGGKGGNGADGRIYTESCGAACPVTISNQSSTQPSCHGTNDGTITITATGGASLSYTINSGTPINNSTGVFTGLNPGTYTIAVSDGNCTANGTNIVIADPAVVVTPVVSSNGPLCTGDTLNLFANSTNGTSYEWTGPNNFSNQQNPTKDNVTTSDSGTYTVIASIGSCESSPAMVSISIEQGPSLNNVSSNSPLCTGATLELNADSSTGASYAWIGPNGFSVNLQSTTRPNITVPDSGDYQLTVSVGNCSATEIVHVVVDETPIAPVLTASSTTICASDSVEVCAPSGFASYLWNQNGETTECGAAKFAGGLWVDVTATNGCSVRSNTLSISVLPVPTVSIVKQGDTLSTFGAVSYQWFKDGGAISGATSAVYIAQGPGTYSVQITDVNGCKATSSGLVITGIREFLTLQRIEVFPNPLSGKFNIRYSGEGSKSVDISLFNVIGEQVYHRTALFQNGVAVPIDVSNCSKGIYFLQVQTSSERVIQKLVIE